MVGTAVGAGVALYTANEQANAAENAANTQADAASQAAAANAAAQERQYQMNRADIAPWRNAGQLSLSALMYGMGLSPSGYVPGMSTDVVGMIGGNAAEYSQLSKQLEGGNQWKVVTPPGYRRNMVVENTSTGERRTVPLRTERDTTSLKRVLSSQAAASGWGVYGETVPQAGAIIKGPDSKPSEQQLADISARMAELGGVAAGVDPNYAASMGGLQSGDLTRKFTLADFEADPGYAFRLAEGEKAIQRSAAAKGNLLSGTTLKELDRYNSGMASQEYGNAYARFNQEQQDLYNMLAGVAGTGQSSTQYLGNQGAQMASNIGSTNASAISQAGNARAAGTVGATGAWNNAIGSLGNMAQQAWAGYQSTPSSTYSNGFGSVGSDIGFNYNIMG